ERYERVTTMMTINLDFTEWGDIFPASRILGAATLDRLRHGAYRLILEGESYRAPRPLPEVSQNTSKMGLRKGVKSPILDPRSRPHCRRFEMAPLRRPWVALYCRSVTASQEISFICV
ncbi:ATP-binding protein, partial [Acidithiobacillus sp. MC6.1]|nr:ATP-binding protein [Acidithiobacillus sp. MC6.1]